MSLVIFHAFTKSNSISLDTTLEEIFSNRTSLWSDVSTTQLDMYFGLPNATGKMYCYLVNNCTEDQVENNVNTLRNTTVLNLLRMSAGLDDQGEEMVNNVWSLVLRVSIISRIISMRTWSIRCGVCRLLKKCCKIVFFSWAVPRFFRSLKSIYFPPEDQISSTLWLDSESMTN